MTPAAGRFASVPAMLRTALAVIAGGAVGTLARWGVAEAGQRLGWSVWVFLVLVNVVGAFALGWFLARHDRASAHPLVGPFIAAGVLGSFTTFSGFTVEAVEGVRNGAGLTSLSFVLGSLVLGMVAVTVGRVVGVRT